MKINIITRHAIANYGSLLQSYATQQIIEEMGFQSEIINYIPLEEKGIHIAKSLCKNSSFWNKNKITRIIYQIIQTPNYKYSYDKFENFRKEILTQTKIEYNSIEDLVKNVPEADIYCTGGDQVWGNMPIAKKEQDAYFLEFAPEDKKCISYASSFGTETLNQKQLNELSSKLQKYSKILVREHTAVDIIKKCKIDNVECVLDPTLLLDKNKWQKLIYDSNIKVKGKYILVYQLHKNKQFDKYVKKLAKKTKLKLIRVSPAMQSLVRPGKLIFMPKPKEFLKYIKNAKYIVTDSFHGTVFSILFEKEFIDILPKTTSERIKNILKVLKIEDRILTDFEDFETINKEINYNLVNELLKKEKEKSKKLLLEAINN